MPRSRWVAVAALLAAGCSSGVSGQGSPNPSVTSSAARVVTPTASATPTPPSGVEGDNVQRVRVVRVIDGDTAVFQAETAGTVYSSTAQTTNRLLEIDTPETVKPGTPVQCYGPEASAQLKDLIAQRVPSVPKYVWVERDKEARDKYGRYLVYVWDESGNFVNEQMVLGGFAKAVLFRPNDKYWTVIQAAQVSAKSADRGLWKACAPRPAPTTTRPTPKPPAPPAPPPAPTTDPRFPTCKAAKAAGYGPYTRGQDPEYDWYTDRDGDGVVCE